VPERVGPYKIVREISRGGQGMVCVAVHAALGHRVALKVLLDSGGAPRFRQEGQILIRLDHPNVIRVSDLGEERGRHYLAMEFVEGSDLKRHVLDQGIPPWTWTVGILAKVADALEACHQAGVVHRDVKPANVLLEAKTQRPVVVDFGLVGRDANHFQSVERVQSLDGEIKGTPGFMSPEQADAGSSPVGPLSDVYSLGATLYFLLTGMAPFRGATPMNVVMRVLRDPPPDPRDERPNTPPALAELCLAAMAKDPGDRPASAAAFAEALRAIHVEGPRSSRVGRVAAGVALLALGVGVGAAFVPRGTPPPVRASAGPTLPDSGSPDDTPPPPAASPEDAPPPAVAKGVEILLPGRLSSPALVDVDGDGIKDLIGVTSQGSIVAVDLRRRKVAWETDTSELVAKSQPLAWEHGAEGELVVVACVTLPQQPGPHVVRVSGRTGRKVGPPSRLAQVGQPPFGVTRLQTGERVLVLRPQGKLPVRLVGLDARDAIAWTLTPADLGLSAPTHYGQRVVAGPEGQAVWWFGDKVLGIRPPAGEVAAKIMWGLSPKKELSPESPGALVPLIAVSGDVVVLAWRTRERYSISASRGKRGLWLKHREGQLLHLSLVDGALALLEPKFAALLEVRSGTIRAQSGLPTLHPPAGPARVVRSSRRRYLVFPFSGQPRGLYGLVLPRLKGSLTLSKKGLVQVITGDLQGDGIDEALLIFEDPPRVSVGPFER
jgi:hypothetical protein